MTPDMIENVLTTKKLPYIDTTLEDISLIDNQRRLLKRLGYSVNKSNSKLTSPLVDDSYFSKMEKAFSMFIQINTGKDIELIAVSEMENILKSIDTNMSPSIQLLSALHLKRTFLITCYENMIEYQEWFINDLF